MDMLVIGAACFAAGCILTTLLFTGDGDHPAGRYDDHEGDD